ncbi:histidine phosphatase family protein [Lacticaseibacillus yichunensis]|uniref:Histidine phosphatase family protein n=1 Tax=Lacticaseibacillus yichunensis TaxID=2486015 RepID=A0ABW4CQP8_9LACO|nr:histidine phosphatase family protein [Lacticaseibacillus yichunensis]
MQTVYLMRHGETLFNVQGRIQGWCDSPLTAKGIQQGKQARDWFQQAGIHFGAAYCSTAERAADTLELVTAQPYTRVKGLREWGFGEFEAQPEYLNPKIPYGDFFVPYGGESETQIRTRIGQTVLTLMQHEPAETTLIVSHAGAIRNFMSLWPQPDGTQQKKRLPNCGIVEYRFDGHEFFFQRLVDPAQA